MYPDNFNYITQPLFQQQRSGMFGAPQMQGQPPMMQSQPMQGMPQMGGTLPQMGGAMPQPNGQQQHHSALHNMLPYLAFGLLGGSLMGGGGLGGIAPLFGLGGLAAKHFGLFK